MPGHSHELWSSWAACAPARFGCAAGEPSALHCRDAETALITARKRQCTCSHPTAAAASAAPPAVHCQPLPLDACLCGLVAPPQVHALLPSEPAYAMVEVPGAARERAQTAAVGPEANRAVWEQTLEVGLGRTHGMHSLLI